MVLTFLSKVSNSFWAALISVLEAVSEANKLANVFCAFVRESLRLS